MVMTYPLTLLSSQALPPKPDPPVPLPPVKPHCPSWTQPRPIREQGAVGHGEEAWRVARRGARCRGRGEAVVNDVPHACPLDADKMGRRVLRCTESTRRRSVVPCWRAETETRVPPEEGQQQQSDTMHDDISHLVRAFVGKQRFPARDLVHAACNGGGLGVIRRRLTSRTAS